MYYPDYLVHYNKNHSPKNGQFTSGDGDGDGVSNDHAHRSKEGKKKGLSKKAKVGLGVGIAASVVGTAAIIAGAAFVKDRMDGKALAESWNKKVADARARQHVENLRQKKLDQTLKEWGEVNKRQMDAIESRMYGNNRLNKNTSDYKPKGLAFELKTIERWNRDKYKKP